MSKKTFRPPWWAIVLVLLLGGVMSFLGVWQLQRGQAKAELLAHYKRVEAEVPRELTAGAWSEPGVVERARARGVFNGDMQLLLDNQSRNRTPGYRVWTPMALVNGGTLIVDRGWIPAGGDRDKLPALPVPQGEVDVEGYWRSPPEPGMRLEVDNCAGGPWPRIVQYPTVDELRCLYGEFVAGGVLLMDPGLPGGFTREWTSGPEMSPTKHYGYAAQWFVFTVLLIALFVKFSFRPTQSS